MSVVLSCFFLDSTLWFLYFNNKAFFYRIGCPLDAINNVIIIIFVPIKTVISDGNKVNCKIKFYAKADLFSTFIGSALVQIEL